MFERSKAQIPKKWSKSISRREAGEINGRTILGCVVALIVLAVAVRPRRGGDPGESRLGQRTVTVSIIIVFAFGISVPALVSADNAEHKAHVGPAGIHLTDNEVKGRELFARSCTVCHTLAAVKSVGRIGPNLDVLVGHQITTPAAPANSAERQTAPRLRGSWT